MRRVYIWCLRAYPEAFRARYGRELLQTFDLGVSAARQRGPLATSIFICTAIADALFGAFHERRTRSRLATSAPRPSMATTLLQDIRFALRSLRGRPGYTGAALLTLSVGIGATTALFSLVDAILVRPLPYQDPDRLAFVWTKLDWVGVPRAWMNGRHIALLQDEATRFAGLAAIRVESTQMTGPGDPAFLSVGRATANWLDVLGVAPAIGRGFAPGEDRQGAAKVALLGHALWQERFGADPSAIGRRIDLDGQPHEIVGVLPRDFRFLVHSSLGGPSGADLWVPGTWSLREMPWDGFSFAMLARVKPSFTMAEAQAELDAIGERLDRERYRDRGFGWQMVGVQADLVKEARPALVALLGAAACVLLIACANVAGLLLVHATARRREMAIRIAIGARRARLLGQLLVESLVLSAAAAAIGVVLAYLAVDAFVASTALTIPRLAEVTVDGRALLFAAGVALVTGVGFSLAPALHASRPDVAGSLKDGTRGSDGPHGQRLRASLVVGEIALASIVLVGAALFGRTMLALAAVDPGFQASGVLTFTLDLTPARYPDAPSVIGSHERVRARLSALPGVEAAGAASGEPLSGRADQMRVRPEGREEPDQAITVDAVNATPGYFRALGASLVRGRDFSDADRDGADLVVIVDEHLARAAWPNEDPLGRRLVFSQEVKPVVVGVVRQPRLYRIDKDDRPQVYIAMAQDGSRRLAYVLRTSGDPAALARPVRAAIRDLDPLLPIAQMTPMTSVVDETLAERRLAATLAAAFAAVAALLAGLGLYGLMAYSVAKRRHEFGIRIALGAGAAEIRRLVLRRAVILVVTGLALGLCAALALSRVIAAHLFGVSSTDPITYAAVALALAAVAILASHLPVRRATRVDPISALRAE